jgi:molybdate transport system substrate-binding protein
MPPRARFGFWLPTVALVLGAPAARADTVLVAVATNFVAALDTLEPAFTAQTGHALNRAAGATGQLYAQIVSGAPFDVLLAADQERPTRLAAEGLGAAASQFTYAQGQLVLFGPTAPERIAQGLNGLADASLRRLAIANPLLAPYGLAAQQTLEQLGLWQTLQPKLVRGENIGQALTLVVTGNAELGFVAGSQVLDAPAAQILRVPASYYDPIRQDAILLTRAADRPAALSFMAFLHSAAARELIERAGYTVDASGEARPAQPHAHAPAATP